MAKFTFKNQNIAEVETPPLDQITMFIDEADNKLKVKFDSGSIKEVVYSSAGPPVDKNFVQVFNATDTVAVTHNLGKIPTVFAYDTATGKEVKGEIEIDIADQDNKLTVRFNVPLTGKVVCN